MKYTQKEINRNIEELSKTMNQKKLERTDLSKEINDLKKQIKEWEELDLSQLKMF